MTQPLDPPDRTRGSEAHIELDAAGIGQGSQAHIELAAGWLGLQRDDLERVARIFNVDESQILRDHAISHVLAALSTEMPHELLFFGGTALSRTHRVNGRLSEDIDLIALTDRTGAIPRFKSVVERSLQRVHGRVTWTSDFSAKDDVSPALATTPDGVSLKVQLLGSAGYTIWPSEVRPLTQRYADAPPAQMRVPTRDAFIGWKTTAWIDRRASRDLWDLWALSEAGPFTDETVSMFKRFGPTRTGPKSWMFRDVPSVVDWRTDLGGQTDLRVEPVDAMRSVRLAWATATGEDWGD